MTNQTDSTVVGIRFQKVGKIYHFDAGMFSDLRSGDYAVVETSRGKQLGEVVQLLEEPSRPPHGSWKPITRKATPRDLLLRQLWQKKALEAMITCREKAADMKLDGVKIISAEYTFDGKRLSFLYSTETEERIELKSLKKVLQRTYKQSRVEMRQIGPRDVAKITGGMGACGMEAQCCTTFLTEFSPISIKMAKEQGLPLNPSRISGACGRIKCCMAYEFTVYKEQSRSLPRLGEKINTANGKGRVVEVNILKRLVSIDMGEGKIVKTVFPKVSEN